jgi:hypothetical protein
MARPHLPQFPDGFRIHLEVPRDEKIAAHLRNMLVTRLGPW